MGKSILIVDDQVEFLEIFSKKLLSEGYTVSLADSAVRGLEEARKTHPDLILMDVNMPGVNGIEALAALKEDPATADIKVVFITNLGNPAEAERNLNSKASKDSGAAGYIQKTSDMQNIVAEVKSYAG